MSKMKKIIEWVKTSNHYYHIGLLAALALVMMSVGAFEFGAQGIWTNVWQCAKFGILAGLLIEAYQVIIGKSFDIRNSLGDLLADLIGLVLGVGVYLLLAWGVPTTAIIMLCWSALCCVFAFVISEWRNILLLSFLGCLIVGFSLFVYA